MTCINETKQNKTKKKLYNYCHLYQSILVSVMPFGYNLRGSIQIVKNLFFIRIPCSLSFLFGFLVHSTGSMCIYLLSNLSQPSRIYIHQIDFYNNFAFFLLCLNPYLWAQCLWATFSGFKIISSAYETTFCDWLSRPMKMIFIPKSFSKEKQK